MFAHCDRLHSVEDISLHYSKFTTQQQVYLLDGKFFTEILSEISVDTLSWYLKAKCDF